MTLPVIRLEIERMKQTILVALSDYSMQLDEDIQNSVEEYFTSDRVRGFINTATQNAINEVIKEEVERFFKYGDGRLAIRDATLRKFNSDPDKVIE